MIEGRAVGANGPLHRYDSVDRHRDFFRPSQGRVSGKNRRLDHAVPSAGWVCRALADVISLHEDRRG